MNQATFIGNLVAPAVAKSANGNSFITFTLAVNRKYKNNNETLYVECAKNGDNANLLPYLTKGQKVAVSGRVSCRAYTNKQNLAAAVMELSVYELELVGKAKEQQAPF